ncbi:hypothetical protein V6N13_087128 [Hibiscus sabdariffa]
MAPHGTLFLRCLVHSLRQRTSPDSGDWLCDDVVGWKGDVNHQFTVKSGYWLRAAIPEDNSDKCLTVLSTGLVVPINACCEY